MRMADCCPSAYGLEYSWLVLHIPLVLESGRLVDNQWEEIITKILGEWVGRTLPLLPTLWCLQMGASIHV